MQGTRIGPFLVHEKLGSHKRHHVYRATQIEQHRDVALKFIKVPPDVSPARAISRIQRETKILKQLDHPNLVKVHGAGIENGQIFFALGLIEGESLSGVLSRRNKLAWEQAWDYARQIACVLEYLHSQEMLHLKLTPDKILITPDGQVKVSDLRLNRTKRKRWDSVRQKSMDVAAYIAPEQFAGEKGTVKCDFYALGAILFEMLTGKLPHTADSFAALGKQKAVRKAPLVSEFTLECPMWMEKIVEALLEIDPEKRPYSARSIIVALDDVKRADRKGTGVAEKLAGGFSPLTAGKDKADAKKALGIRKKKRKEDDLPFYQTTGFLGGSLTVVILLMLALLVFALKPLSPEQLLVKAEQQAGRGENYAAQKTLLELLERKDNQFTTDAEMMLVELRTKKLMAWAENPPILAERTAKGTTRDFLRAYDYEKVERYNDALVAYDRILTNVSFENLDDRHFYQAAKARKQEVSRIIADQTADGKKSASSGLPAQADGGQSVNLKTNQTGENSDASQTPAAETNLEKSNSNPKIDGLGEKSELEKNRYERGTQEKESIPPVKRGDISS